MDVLFVFTMIALGFIGSFFSGLFGIGGAIINYPLLLFVPAALGVASFSAQEISAMSMVQVFFASLAGVWAYQARKRAGGPSIHKGLVLYMGSSIGIGSWFGGMVSTYLAGSVIHLIYGVLALVAVILMLVPAEKSAEIGTQAVAFNKFIAVPAAGAVGAVSGIVGAGGAFILIPIMLTLLRIPARTAIASSLAIVLISAGGGMLGKLVGGPIPVGPTLAVIAGSLLGSPMGSKLSERMNIHLLRYGLVILITATAVKVWSSIL